MNVVDYCGDIIFGKTLEQKLLSPSIVSNFGQKVGVEIPSRPARESEFDFSSKRLKFPKPGSFHIDKNKAIALHFLQIMSCWRLK